MKEKKFLIFLNYTHEKYEELPTFKKEGYVFDGWLLNTKEKFTKESFLEKEMTLYANFVLKKDFKITIKGFPLAPLVMANYNDQISYDDLPKVLLKNETISYFRLDGNKIANDFIFNFKHDIELIPFFKETIEYEFYNDFTITLKRFHSANEVVNIPKLFEINGKKYEYTSLKPNVLDLPRVKELNISSNHKTKYFKNFISSAPNLEKISFLDSTSISESDAIYFEKDCLSNITTLKSFAYGIALDFNNNYFSIMDFGFKFNPSFELKLLYKDVFMENSLNNFNYFPESKSELETYKNISTISFESEGEIKFTKNSFSIFPNLKIINLNNGVTSLVTSSFNNLDLTINASESVKSLNFNFLETEKVNNLKIKSKSELKISGSLHANKLDFIDVNNLLFNEHSSIFIYEQIKFPSNVNYLVTSDECSLVVNMNLDKKVDVYFESSRPESLISNETFKPFKGVNGGLEEDLFNFYII